MDILEFWENNQMLAIIILLLIISLLIFLITSLPRIFSKRMTQEQKEEIESQKQDQKAIDLFDSSTSISELEKQIRKEKESLEDWEREGSITQKQMEQLVRRGKDRDSTEFDKKSLAYQYQLSSNKLNSIEQNIASTNNNLLYIESVKWMRENEKRLETKLWATLKQLSPDQLVKATNELRTSSKALDLPVDSVIPTSSEIVAGRTEAYDEFMKKIDDEN